jgi:hypothetical protein
METIGTVRRLKLNEGRGFVELDVGGGIIETFIIWWIKNSRGPVALFTTELTTALVHGLRVEVVHGQTSAYIEDLRIWAPGAGPRRPERPTPAGNKA